MFFNRCYDNYPNEQVNMNNSMMNNCCQPNICPPIIECPEERICHMESFYEVPQE